MKPHPQRPARRDRGYLVVLFVIVLAFVAVTAAMQVLILTSVGTASRAYDSYRQGATELTRLQRIVTESLLELGQVSVATPSRTLSEAVRARIQDIATPDLATEVVPDRLPETSSFPDVGRGVDPVLPLGADIQSLLSPEQALLAGSRAAVSPELRFVFTSDRVVLDTRRTYQIEVKARLLGIPLTRFAIAAYDLPAEIGTLPSQGGGLPPSELPAGLVPSRDTAFIDDLQAQSGVLPYHYRRRATLAAAYQYVFSQPFADRMAEYAGITHYHDLDAPGRTAVLAGMVSAGQTTSWDLGTAGVGTYGTITQARDAAVLFTESAARTLRLHDSTGESNAPALFLLILGPSEQSKGPLTVELSTIERPVVVVAANVRVVTIGAASLNGALFLDPNSSVSAESRLALGHLSYWAGASGISDAAISTRALPPAAEALAPRVVYAVTTATRL